MLGWTCKGIGINLREIEPYLDEGKCLAFLKETLDGRDIQEVITENGGEFHIAPFVDGDFYDGLGELFRSAMTPASCHTETPVAIRFFSMLRCILGNSTKTSLFWRSVISMNALPTQS